MYQTLDTVIYRDIQTTGPNISNVVKNTPLRCVFSSLFSLSRFKQYRTSSVFKYEKGKPSTTSRVCISKRNNCDNRFFCRCDNNFRGHLSLLSLYNLQEGNSLAVTEFVRLLEVAGSATAKRSNGKTENRQLFGSNSRV